MNFVCNDGCVILNRDDKFKLFRLVTNDLLSREIVVIPDSEVNQMNWAYTVQCWIVTLKQVEKFQHRRSQLRVTHSPVQTQTNYWNF